MCGVFMFFVKEAEVYKEINFLVLVLSGLDYTYKVTYGQENQNPNCDSLRSLNYLHTKVKSM